MSNFFGHSGTTVDKWVLDAGQYRTEIEQVARDIKKARRQSKDLALVQAELAKSMGKVESSAGKESRAISKVNRATEKSSSVFDAAKFASIGYAGAIAAAGAAAVKLVSAYDSVLSQGSAYSRMMKRLPHEIDSAAAATQGLISRLDLATAASRASALGVGLNAESFAQLAKGATLASQKMGTEVTKALEDLTLGMARMSPKILDNLGIIIKVSKANDAWAKANHRTVKSMTDVEKRVAFNAEVIRKLGKITKGTAIETRTLSEEWMIFKTIAKDSKGWLSGLVGSLGGQANPVIHSVVTMAKLQRDAIAQLRKQLRDAKANSVSLSDKAMALVDKQNEETRLANEKKAVALAERKAKAAKAYAVTRAKNLKAMAEENRLGKEAARIAKIQADELFRQARAKAQARGNALTASRTAFDASISPEAEANAQGIAAMQRADAMRARANERAIAQQARLHAIEKERIEYLRDTGVSAVANFAGAMWNLADAAIQNGENFGKAMLMMLKSTLLGIAQQATVKAVFETAEGVAATARYDVASASAHFTSAAIFGGVAAVSGAAGLGISAATASHGGGAARAPGATASARHSAGAQGGKKETRDITVVVHFDKSDPTSRYLARKQIKAEVQEAMA